MKQFKIFLLTSMIIFFTACGGGVSSDDGTTLVNNDTPQTIAIGKIKAYANDPTQPVPMVEDYLAVGVVGVTVENITEINDVVTSLIEEDVDTKEEIQAIADDLDIVLPDTMLPVITLSGASPMEVLEGDTYNDAGAIATDDRDGIIDVVTVGSVNTAMVGTYTIIYTATDNAGNTATSSRTVLVVLSEDITPPIITLVGKESIGIIQGNVYSEEGATAVDDRDGTVEVIRTGSVNTSVVGTYIITYTATDSADNTATETRTVRVEPMPNATPQANAGVDKTTEVNKSITITGTSSSDSDGYIVQYEWKKGDTIIGTKHTISYLSTVIGTDILTLTVTDDDGAQNSDSMIVTVIEEIVVPNKAPIANAGVNKSTEVNKAVTVTGTGSDSDGNIVQYEWKKGNTVIGNTATITYTPTMAGTDTLTLTVTDDDGAQDSDSMTVTVIKTVEYIPYEIPEIDETTRLAYLDAVNAARAEEQDCGVYGMMGPVDPLVWNDALYKSSYEHSDDMMRSNTFTHDGSGTEYDWTAVILELERGSELRDRVDNNGYLNWANISENIAAYKGFNGDGLVLVMDGWIDSDGHCRNLMNEVYEEVGMAHVSDGNGDWTDYWTQNFGRRH